MKTQSSIKVIVQEELESFLLDFGVYLHKSLLVCVPISCNHIILTMNYIYYITVPTLFISFLHYILGCFLLLRNSRYSKSNILKLRTIKL